MARRLVLLEFEDPDSANAFVMNDNIAGQLAFTVRGLFMLPTSLCECPGKKDIKEYARGKKSGIWLHRKCKKPSPHWVGGIDTRLAQALGHDLREVE
jgi:hypothetical protein